MGVVLSGQPPAQNPVPSPEFYSVSNQMQSVEDSNGNRISGSWSSDGSLGVGIPNIFTIQDTENRSITERHFQNGSTSGVVISYPDQNNTPQSITVTYGKADVNLELICGVGNGHCGTGVEDPSSGGPQSWAAVQSITLQNGDQYQFEYVPDGLGEIQTITLPTGGSISYTYGSIDPVSYAGRPVTSRTVTAGGLTGTWNFQYANYMSSSPMMVTVTDPGSNDTVYTCSQLTPYMGVYANVSPTCYMTGESIYSGSSTSGGTLLAQKGTTYTQYGCSWIPTADTLTWSGQTTETDSTYDSAALGYSYGCNFSGTQVSTITRSNLKSQQIYNYGSGGSHGALLRNTQYTYQHESNSNYTTANLTTLLAQISIYNSVTPSSSALVAQTITNYDSFSSGGQSGLSTNAWSTNHDSAFGTSQTLPWTSDKCDEESQLNSTSITTSTNYNILGQPTVTTDGNSHQTTYGYGTAATGYGLTTDCLTATTTLPSTTTNGSSIQHIIGKCLDPHTGLLMWTSDQNKNATSYTYENLMRLSGEYRPDGGTTSITYPSPNQVVTQVTEDGQRTATTTVTLDGLGRTISSSTSADTACGSLTVDTAYDDRGRIQSVSNPHCNQSGVTDGSTVYTYDALSRVTNKQNPDGSSQKWEYAGNVIDFWDEMQSHSQRTYDAADRLASVTEPDPTTNALSLYTDYTYNTLGDLTQVDQWGGPRQSQGDHLRKFAYDWTSRLIASNNPEAASSQSLASLQCSGTSSGTRWTTCYSYDGNGNLTSKTDNRNITISYNYDNDNRLTSKGYSDSTPPVTYTYDALISSITKPQWALSPSNTSANLVGQLTQATVTAGSTLAQTTSYSFDAMGRLQLQQQCTPANMAACSSAPYEVDTLYDFAGKPTSNAFPSNAPGNNNQPSSGQGLVLSNAYDVAERLIGITSKWTDTASPTLHPSQLFQASTSISAPGYGPMGLQNALLGLDPPSGTAAASLSRGYDNRRRLGNGVYASGNTAVGGASSTGSITISGAEKSVTATNSPGSVTFAVPAMGFGGNYQGDCTQVWVPEGGNGQYGYYQTVCQTVPCSGFNNVVIGSTPSFTVQGEWETGDTVSPASSLATLINSTSNSPVQAAVNVNGSITLTAATTGAESNYAVTLTSGGTCQ